MYYPIIDKLKEVMASLTTQQETVSRLETTEPYVVRGTITNPTTFQGTYEGNFSDLLNSIRDGYPGLFVINFSIPNTIELNVTVPILLCASSGGAEPQQLETALTYVQGMGIVQFIIHHNNYFGVNTIS